MAKLKLKISFYDYYAKKRDDDKSHREALVTVSRKLVHVIYAVLSKREPMTQRSCETSRTAF